MCVGVWGTSLLHPLRDTLVFPKASSQMSSIHDIHDDRFTDTDLLCLQNSTSDHFHPVQSSF